jgi:transcription elongation factor Elf1
MIAPVILESEKANGNLISVNLQLRDPEDIKIYKKFLETEILNCPHCNTKNKIGDDDLVLRIDSPLAVNSLIQAATPIVTCDQCGTKFELSMLDYTAFKSVTAFIAALRKRYNELKKKG